MVRAAQLPDEARAHPFEDGAPTIEVRALDPFGEQETIEVRSLAISRFSTPGPAAPACSTLDIQIDVAPLVLSTTPHNVVTSADHTADYHYVVAPTPPTPARWHQVAADEPPRTRTLAIAVAVVTCVVLLVLIWR
jgi:hypothetical protein